MKSLNDGTLTRDEALALQAKIRTEHLQDILDLGYRLDDEYEDVLFCEGATTIDGNVTSGGSDTCKSFTLLFVDGDLTVKGNLVVEDDPPAFVVVTGNLHVEGNLLTAGFVEIQGTTTVGGVLVGDYNHGLAKLLGSASAGCWVHNDDYPLDIQGAFEGRSIEQSAKLGAIIECIRAGATRADALQRIE